jgi:hypothetical protein
MDVLRSGLDGLIKSWPRLDLLIYRLLHNGPKCDTADSPAWRLENLLVKDIRIDSPGLDSSVIL